MQKLSKDLAALGLLALSAPVYSQMGMMENGAMNMSMARHRFAMMNGIGPQYASKRNPLSSNTESLVAGKRLFQQNCASCHGQTGIGDGEAGKALNPRPSNIAAFSKMPMATDSYLYWTVAEGGVPLGTAMPSFKKTLSEDEIWKIITYLREL